MEELKTENAQLMKEADNSDYLVKSDNKFVKCGVSWDCFDKTIDLDVTIVALDTYSLEMDAAYYNQTSILNESIIHSGDNKSGDGDDEEITINLKQLPIHCHSMWFIVNAYSGGTFKDVETAKFTLYDENNQEIHSYQIVMSGYNSTALLLGTLYRDINEIDWRYKKIEKGGNGLNFVESKYLMENALNSIYDEYILNERPRDRTKTYELEKSEHYVINPQISKVTVGLGWDPATDGIDIDVDGSVIIFNKDSNNNDELSKKDVISFSNLSDTETGGKYVQHHGDNLTGDGEGDDESIDIFLNNIPSQYVLCVVINIYKGALSFDSIKNCFARLIDDKNNELCRYTLSGQYHTNGMIMCSMDKLKNECWSLKAHGIGCKGTMAMDSIIDCKKVCQGQELNSNQHEQQSIAGQQQSEQQHHADNRCTCVIL